MSLFSKIKKRVFNESIDSIEWTDHGIDTMIWRFLHNKAEIKNGAQLIVREAQVAVLVNEGQFADVYQTGRYELTTKDMPILSALNRWRNSFNSPFKAEVYFVNTKQFLNLRWSTVNPVMMSDSEFGPIRLRAFGSYSFRVESNPIKFIRNVAGTDGNFTAESVTNRLRNFVINKFTNYLIESKIAVLDLAANLNEFSSEFIIALKDDFSEYGIELTKFLIESISLPKTVEEALDKQTSMGVIDNMTNYMQTFNSQNQRTITGQSSTGQARNTAGVNFQHASPPSIPPKQMYHVAVSGVQQGPFPVAQLQQMAQWGQLTPDTLVWTAGMATWAAANSVPFLSQLFGAVPPPL